MHTQLCPIDTGETHILLYILFYSICVLFRALICKLFKEPRNRFPAWRNRFLVIGSYKLLKSLQIRAQVLAILYSSSMCPVFMLCTLYRSLLSLQIFTITINIKLKKSGWGGGRGGVQCCLYTQRSSCNGVNNHKLLSGKKRTWFPVVFAASTRIS